MEGFGKMFNSSGFRVYRNGLKSSALIEVVVIVPFDYDNDENKTRKNWVYM